jgi:hypothetical protein
MKNKIKLFLSLLIMLVLPVSTVTYASGGDDEAGTKQLVINGVDFSNIDFNNFNLSDLTDEQWLVIKDIISMYGLDNNEWGFSEDFVEDLETEETTSPFSDYELTGEEPTRAEKKGTGSTGTAIVTSNDLEGAMEFVKITTKDDQMFYLVIDYTQDEDNVYFLDMVSVNDLFRIAENATDADENPIYVDYSQFKDTSKDDSKGEKETEEETEASTESDKDAATQKKTAKRDNMMQNIVLLLGIILIGAAAFAVIYITKVKNKKVDEDDDDFENDMLEDEEEGSNGDAFESDDGDNSLFDMELANESDEIEETAPEKLVDIDYVNESNFAEDDETDNSEF